MADLIFRGQGTDTGCLDGTARYPHGLAAKVIKLGDFGGVVGGRHGFLFRLSDPHGGGERGHVCRRN